MPPDVPVSGLVVFALADARDARLQVLRIGRPDVQVRGADLDVPADRVHHQGQHARVIDEVEKGLVMRQGIAHGVGLVGSQPFLYPNAFPHLVDRLEQPVEFGLVEELLEHDKSLLVEVLFLLRSHCEGHGVLTSPATC